MIEITLHFIAYHCLYFVDLWNVFDLIVILLSIVFVLLDLKADKDSTLSGFLKIRGIFRLLRIFLLLRKLNQLKEKRDLQRKRMTSAFQIKSTVEKVVEILTDLRDNLDTEEVKTMSDLNFCIKMISQNRLYDADLDEGSGGNELVGWMQQKKTQQPAETPRFRAKTMSGASPAIGFVDDE